MALLLLYLYTHDNFFNYFYTIFYKIKIFPRISNKWIYHSRKLFIEKFIWSCFQKFNLIFPKPILILNCIYDIVE